MAKKKSRQRGLGSPYLRGSIWWIKYKGERMTSHSTNRDDAVRMLAELHAKGARMTSGRVTMSDLFDLFIEDRRVKQLRALKIEEQRLEKNVRPFFGPVRADALTTTFINQYINRRKEAGAANASINRELSLVRASLNFGMNHVPPLVWRKIPIKKLPEENIRQGYLAEKDYERLREALPEYLRAFFVVAVHIGRRASTLRALRWDQVDLEAGAIRIHSSQEKAKTSAAVPIYGEMESYLRHELARRNAGFPQCRYVFHKGGEQVGNFDEDWKAACRAAGLEGLLFHDLRRTAVRNLLKMGFSEKEVMMIVGHKTAAMLWRYHIIDELDLIDRARRFDSAKKSTIGTIRGTSSPGKSETKDE